EHPVFLPSVINDGCFATDLTPLMTTLYGTIIDPFFDDTYTTDDYFTTTPGVPMPAYPACTTSTCAYIGGAGGMLDVLTNGGNGCLWGEVLCLDPSTPFTNQQWQIFRTLYLKEKHILVDQYKLNNYGTHPYFSGTYYYLEDNNI